MTHDNSTVFLSVQINSGQLPKLLNIFSAINNRFANPDITSPLRIVDTQKFAELLTIIYSVDSHVFKYIRNAMENQNTNGYRNLKILEDGIIAYREISLA